MVTWINFKELRERLDFRAVLRHYNVQLKEKGRQAHGYCPLPTHPTRDGKRRSPSFSVNLDRNIWQCFGCGASGNVIDFACRMEGLNPDSGQDIRKTAIRLQELFQMDASEPSPNDRQIASRPAHHDSIEIPHRQVTAHENAGQVAPCPAIVNAPLDFELKGLDPSHPYLKERGFTAETIAHFGLGYCGKGLMQGRIAIPLHDQHGKLIGYAGRLVDDSAIDEFHPKYKFPGDRDRGGEKYAFKKSLFLYNGFAVGAPVSDLIVVEGFPGVWWLWQCGFPDVVALMGSSCSPEQVELIINMVRPEGCIWVFTDSDEAGELCGRELILAVSPHRWSKWAKLRKGQPTDYDAHELKGLLNPPVGSRADRAVAPTSQKP